MVTSQFRAADDVLMHADQHDALRADLLRAMSLGVQTDADAEDRVSALSLRNEQPFGQKPPAPCVVEFEFSSTLDESALRDRLGYLGHRVLETTATSIRWGLGLPSGQDADHVTITLADKTARGVAEVAGASATARRIAAADLRSFIARTMFLLKQADADVAYRGPREWTP